VLARRGAVDGRDLDPATQRQIAERLGDRVEWWSGGSAPNGSTVRPALSMWATATPSTSTTLAPAERAGRPELSGHGSTAP